mgnify:CR=1 FL=1|tara:strand:- start:1229 stop:1489 length:261 start_codon:yes stop_codon:yes gene_type:complete
MEIEKININLTPLQAAELSQFLTNASERIQAQATTRGRIDFDEKLFIDSASAFTKELQRHLNAGIYSRILDDYEQAEEIHRLTNNN